MTVNPAPSYLCPPEVTVTESFDISLSVKLLGREPFDEPVGPTTVGQADAP
jgi:hypothetical protein